MIGVGALLFVVQAGLFVGAPGVEGLFLARFGAAALRVMYIVVGVIVPLTVMAASAAIVRLRRSTLYRVVPLVILVLLVISRIILVNQPLWFYPVLYVLMNVFSTLGAFFTWGMAGALCDARQAKRLFPYIAAGGILGSAGGGLATPWLVGKIGAPNLITVWAAMMVIALVLTVILTRRIEEQPRSSHRRDGIIKSIVGGYRQLGKSRLLPVFSAMAASMVAVYFLLSYPFSRLAVDRFRDEESLAAFFGLFQGIATGTGLLLSLVVSKRLYARFGFLGSLSGYALVFLIGFAVSSAVPQFTPVVLFRYVQVSFYLGIAAPAYQAVFNVVPSRNRERTRILIDGVLTQTGMLLAGVLLILLDLLPGIVPHFIAGAAISVFAVILAIIARSRYGEAVMTALRQGDGALFEHTGNAVSDGASDPRAVEIAIDALRNGDVATRRAAAALGGSIPHPEATDALVAALSDEDPEVRRLSVRALADGKATAALLDIAGLLSDSVGAVREEAIKALGRLARYQDGLVRTLEPLLFDSSHVVAAAAAGCILSRGAHSGGRECIEKLLDSGEAEKMVVALEAYRSEPEAMPRNAVLKLLDAIEPAVRASAARAIACLRPIPEPALLMSLLADEEPAVAESVQEALIGAGADVEDALLNALGSNGASPAVSEEKILDVLAGMDRACDAIKLTDFAARCSHRLDRYRRQIELLTSSSGRVPRRVVGALIDCSKRVALLMLRAKTIALGKHDHFAFEGLKSSDPEDRAYALEAIESILDRPSIETAGEVLSRLVVIPENRQNGSYAFSRKQVMDIVSDHDPWLDACVISELSEYLDPDWLNESRNSSSPLVSDAARRIGEVEYLMAQHSTIPMVERVINLRKAPMFAQLSPQDLESVAAVCEEEDYDPGETIDAEGEPGDRMYLVVEGSVRIVQGETKREIAVRGEGEAIGEMSLISHRPRNATMIAGGPVKTLVLQHRAFEQILKRSPDVSLAVMQVLCDRVAEATLKIVEREEPVGAGR